MLYVNFEKMKVVRNLFEADFDIQRILTSLSIFAKAEINPNETLIVFDEIQAAVGGLTALKYFCEDAPQYHVIAAGSLLGMSLHQDTSFPVGKVDFLYLKPMSFPEFLKALDESRLADLIENPNWKIVSVFKDKLMNYLRYYLFCRWNARSGFAFYQTRIADKANELKIAGVNCAVVVLN